MFVFNKKSKSLFGWFKREIVSKSHNLEIGVGVIAIVVSSLGAKKVAMNI